MSFHRPGVWFCGKVPVCALWVLQQGRLVWWVHQLPAPDRRGACRRSLILHLKGPRLPKKASAVHVATVKA